MEKKRIIEKMKQLAELIHYDPGDITPLANAMCVNVLDNGNTSNKEYYNGSLATLGDTVLKMIITEKLYLEGKDRGDITINKSDIEKNTALHLKTLKYNIQSFAYNDQYFFDEAPKHLQLPIQGTTYTSRQLLVRSIWTGASNTVKTGLNPANWSLFE